MRFYIIKHFKVSKIANTFLAVITCRLIIFFSVYEMAKMPSIAFKQVFFCVDFFFFYSYTPFLLILLYLDLCFVFLVDLFLIFYDVFGSVFFVILLFVCIWGLWQF